MPEYENYYKIPPLPDRKPPMEIAKFEWFEMMPGMTLEQNGTKFAWKQTHTDKDKMTYDSNNGILACVDENGDLLVAPLTQKKLQELEGSGYKKGSLTVPLSNGENPHMPKWDVMKWEQDTKNKK